ncbi:MAG: hypothetical protein ACT4P7_12330 [Gemmatimonadaceae bacterium]
MKRWTLLLISHDTASPRMFSVTDRALRLVAAVGAALMLVAVIGIGSLVAQLGDLRGRPAALVAEEANGAISPQVNELRERVGALQGMLDTINGEDARLRATVGEPQADTSTLLKRLVARLPRFLREAVPTPPAALAVTERDTADRRQMAGASAAADTMLAHAVGLAEQYRAIGPRGMDLDTLDVLSLRPESLQVAAYTATPRVKRVGRVVEWAPGRGGALLAGFDAEVARAVEATAGVWEIDLRAAGGLVARVSAPGLPSVRVGDRVVADQPLIVVSAQGKAGPQVTAFYELRRNGIALDPTFPRSLGRTATSRAP